MDEQHTSRRRFLGLLGAGAAGAAGAAMIGRGVAGAAPPAATVEVVEPLTAAVPPGVAVRPGFPVQYVSVAGSRPGWGDGTPTNSADDARGGWPDGSPGNTNGSRPGWNDGTLQGRTLLLDGVPVPLVAGCPTGTDAAGPAPAALVPAGGASTVEVAGGLTARAVNTTAGPRRRTRAAATVPPRLGIVRPVRREQWGADDAWLHVDDDPALELRDPPVWAPLQVITVHHTVTANGDPDPAATLRAIYDDHVHNPARDFGDIGYHVLIDEAGNVYEGRNGEDSSPLFGHRFVDGRWEMVRAAHVALNNTGNFGVALLGDLTSTQPAPQARRALVGVLAVLCLVHDLDPLATVHYVNSAGERDISALAMHRQWLATECPGEAFAPVFDQVRLDVARALRAVGARDTLLAGLPTT